MSANDKLESIDSWRKGTVKIMVSTTAFGMGIDQPYVEIVIRIGCPPTLESMVQEFGRAGRDGRPAQGMLNSCVYMCKPQHIKVFCSIKKVIYSMPPSGHICI